MEGYNNDDVKKMLEMLKEQAESSSESEVNIDAQTTDSVHTDEDIQNMLKEQFSPKQGDSSVVIEDYSFDEVDEFISEEVAEETAAFEEEAPIDEKIEPEEVLEINEESEPEEKEILTDEPQLSFTVPKTPDKTSEIILDSQDDGYIDIREILKSEETVEETFSEAEETPITLEEAVNDYISEIEVKEEIQPQYTVEDEQTEDESEPYEEEPVSEESINYDEVLEGQQGTVFNQFVEDFTGELDDVVFEAEITESKAPDKQYTIFEDWEQIIQKKDFATSEEEIVISDNEDFDQDAGAEEKKMRTDYFNPIVSDNDLDAVDIALMVALGGESEMNETVGFEKIRQAVHDLEEEEEESLENKKIFGFVGEEYNSLIQNIKIKQKYKTDKLWVWGKAIFIALLALGFVIYEIFSWTNIDHDATGTTNALRVVIGFMLLLMGFAVSFDKLIKLFKEPMSFSSLSYIGALIAFFFTIIHDIIIITVSGYVYAEMTFHSVSAILLLISFIYDIFDQMQQSHMFNIVSLSDKKLVLEPYGKINTDDDGEVLESDSYCISKVPTVKKYFARTSAPSSVSMSKLVPLLFSFSIAICVMLLLLLMRQPLNTVFFAFVITLSFLLVCTSIFESEFAFFEVYTTLKKYKTGIVGKSSVSEYGKCDIVYFDDYNIFNKRSVRTKGLKLYDNNEIYRILYHTQAVFSKVGGPLKGVFEFATSEMTHSNKVEIKEISKEGISAVVDGRTSVLIGTGAFMRSRYIHPSYTSADLKLEECGEESIMFIALNGVLGAKLYVTYQFSSEFERLARKLAKHGVRIGIRSSDPNVNNKWAERYGELKQFDISIVRPTLKEIKPHEKSIDSGIVSVKNVRALTEALMMCIKLHNFEALLSKVRAVALVIMGILSFGLVLCAGINIITIWVMLTAIALCTFVMMLLTHLYIKN